MGMYHSSYIAFGARVGSIEGYGDQIDKCEELDSIPHEELNGVGYLLAGNYDADSFFLVTQCDEAGLGSYTRLDSDFIGDPETQAYWTIQIKKVAERIGVELAEEPEWFVIADLS